jgi:hypothetical protein
MEEGMPRRLLFQLDKFFLSLMVFLSRMLLASLRWHALFGQLFL